MDDRPHLSGGTIGAAQVALRSSAFGGLRIERSAPQMKCSSSEALITPVINTICMITFSFPIKN